MRKAFWIFPKGFSYIKTLLQFAIDINSIQLLESLFQPCDEGFFSFAQPYARIVIFLIWRIRSFWIADLCLQVIAMLGLVATYTIPESPLHIRIDVHLDSTVRNSFGDFFRRRT